MIETLSNLISNYGYIILGICIAVESAGFPLPGETALLIAAAYAGSGRLSISIVILVAACAAVLGDALGYWMGRTVGRSLVQKYGNRFWINEEKLKRIEAFYKKYGPKTVFFGRFIGILRTYSAFFAGVSHMSYKTFTLYNASGGILWATIFGLLGYEFRKHLDVIERIAKTIGWGALLVLIIMIAGAFAWRELERHQSDVRRAWVRFLSFPPVERFAFRYRRQIGWLRRRLQPREYLGLHLTIGLLAAATCLWLFSGVTEDVLARDPLVKVDLIILEKLRALSSPVATAILIFITTLGDFLLIGVCLTFVVLYKWRSQRYRIVSWVITLTGGEILNLFLKQLIHRSRPEMPVIRAMGYSFPSGHAMLSLVTYGMFTYFLCLETQSWAKRTALICACATLVFLIGFSRLYLGVHYFSDVIAGFAAGGLWLSTCITATELVRRRKIGMTPSLKTTPSHV